MSRWLWVALPLASLGLSAVWGGVTQSLLGQHVANLVDSPASAPAVLGLITGIAGVTSLVSQPVMGLLSDRTTSRFLGRRNIWILGGAVIGFLMLLTTAASTSVVWLAVAWSVTILPFNGLQAALVAVLPERVPLGVRGRMSGIYGGVSILGTFAGVSAASIFTDIFFGYLAIALIVLVTSLVFAFTTKDHVPPAATSAQRSAKSTLPGLRTAPDFWWAFAGRFLIIISFVMVSGFQLYLLQNYIGVGDGSVQAAAKALVPLTAISTAGILVFSILGGFLADRLGHLRLFVAASTVLLVPAAVVYLLMPTYTGAVIANAIMGVGFGIYLAVDQLLITRVLPSMDDAARDLGIINMANAGPQIFAPAVAGALVTATGSYELLFHLAIAFAVLSAICVRFIKTVD